VVVVVVVVVAAVVEAMVFVLFSLFFSIAIEAAHRQSVVSNKANERFRIVSLSRSITTPPTITLLFSS
jgi:hypothetical protein